MFWDNWPTWVKIAVPVSLGVGALWFFGRGNGEGGTDEGGAVLPLITPSTGPSFPLGAGGFGGSDYAPSGGGTGPSGAGGVPPTSSPDVPIPDGGGDVPPAPPPQEPEPNRPTPAIQLPLTPGQQNRIQNRLRENRDHEQRLLARLDRELEEKLQAINASSSHPPSHPNKVARRQAAKAATATAKAAIKANGIVRRAAIRAMFGAGRA